MGIPFQYVYLLLFLYFTVAKSTEDKKKKEKRQSKLAKTKVIPMRKGLEMLKCKGYPNL